MPHYLHGHAESVLRSHRSRTAANSAGYLLAHLTPGRRLLDVGSGPATITADFAELLGAEQVVALEHSEEAVELSRTELSRLGHDGVTCVQGDIHQLPFADDSFDVTHAHQVLQHVADPVQALRELARVTRPGGLVATRDSDYAAFTWHPAVPQLDDWLALYRRLAKASGGEPDAGRYYRAWAREAGLHDATITCTAWCYAEPESVAWWGGLWAERARASGFSRDALAHGVSEAELQSISDGWRQWAEAPDALFTVPSMELLARVP